MVSIRVQCGTHCCMEESAWQTHYLKYDKRYAAICIYSTLFELTNLSLQHTFPPISTFCVLKIYTYKQILNIWTEKNSLSFYLSFALFYSLHIKYKIIVFVFYTKYDSKCLCVCVLYMVPIIIYIKIHLTKHSYSYQMT